MSLQGFLLTLSFISVSASIFQHKRECILKTSDDGRTYSQRITGLRAECKYQENLDQFYYKISWKPPSQRETVLRYTIFIKYNDSQPSCFNIAGLHKKFEFNRTVGFRKGLAIEYAVVPQPVPKSFTPVYKKAVKCPVVPKLRLLGNKMVEVGSNVTFHCRFEEEPVPKPEITWYYSKDSVLCKRRRHIPPNKHINISPDKRSLTIIKATKEQVGCYLLSAYNDAGESDDEKGFLHLSKPKAKRYQTHSGSGNLMAILFVCISFLCVGFFGAIVIHYRKRKKCELENIYMVKPRKVVYISHCATGKDETAAYLKFAETLRSFDLDVVIDLCSEVEINKTGCLSQWISNNMMNADKHVVIVTSQYLEAINTYMLDGGDVNENSRKVCFEYNLINTNIYMSNQQSHNLVIVSKGLSSSDRLPVLYQDKLVFPFPGRLEVKSGDDLDHSFRRIVGVLLEKEPVQLGELGEYHRI